MASSPSGSGTGTISGSTSTAPTTTTTATSGGSEEEGMQKQQQQQQQQAAAMDLRKEKRKLSNRESARRSRMRKQKHLDDLTAHVAHLRKEKNQILAGLKAITQQYAAVQAENSVLKAQATELGTRLHSLREVLILCLEEVGGAAGIFLCEGGGAAPQLPSMVDSSFLLNPPCRNINALPANQLAIMASAADTMFQY